MAYSPMRPGIESDPNSYQTGTSQPPAFKELDSLDDLPLSKVLPKPKAIKNLQKKVNWNFTNRWFNPYYAIPIAVIIGQTLLLIFSWTFFALTLTEPVPLSYSAATYVQKNYQTVTLIVTLIATLLAVCSVTLYAGAIRYALARSLARPDSTTSLYVIFASIHLSKATPIKNFIRPSWTILSILCALAVSIQTAGYTTLLLPKQIVLPTIMVGSELDLTSPGFQSLMVANAEKVTPVYFTHVLSLSESSGSNAVSTHFSLPSVLNFNHFSYANATMGLLPLALEDVTSKLLSATGNTIPPSVKTKNKKGQIVQPKKAPAALPVQFTITQQGFTANVSCETRVLNATTSPSVVLNSVTDAIFNQNMTLAQIAVMCPGDTVADTFFSDPVITSVNVDAVYGASCPFVNPEGRHQWNLVLTGSGMYKQLGTVICSIFPQVTTVTVDYSVNSKLSGSTSPNFLNSTYPVISAVDAPWLGDFAVDLFLRGLYVGQGIVGNSMGDSILAFWESLSNSTETANEVLAEYVRGVIELSGTLLRTAYTQDDNGLFANGGSTSPDDMRVATNGTHFVTTIGWHQDPATSAGILVAPTFVSLLAILIVIVTLIKTRNHPEPRESHYFDPGDILHIISASTAGGEAKKLPPLDEISVKNSDKMLISLAPVGEAGSKPGFILVGQEGKVASV
ncbi:hypothetical protein GALMADRAFT_128086 [Galerina marginata CBS 339.88]|uniref:Uncharacterized protein n=1 Tax=Galerina marginata (strain CBS 339.88) TaxID=685588 RepID=A0A067SGB9_GALM3|nr:hypothetical protein GALMADRAFT_128086 [Galerina marginata CBS 339.88]